MTVIIREVKSLKDLRRFARFPNVLYRKEKYYVPQLVGADMDTLSPDKNKAFEVCEGKYWLALDEKGKTVGRIAGIINHKYNEKVGKKFCRFGWIDFIDSQEVVDRLFETVEAYAREKGMEIVEGPTGFLEFDVAGVLVDGFDKIPTAYGKYNAPYYEPRILERGYTRAEDYVEYLVTIPQDSEKYARGARLIAERYGLHEAPIRRGRKDAAPYLDGVYRVLNEAYSGIHGYSELTPAQWEDLKRQFISRLNFDYVSIILDSDNQVVAFGVCLPSLSKAIQKVKGHLFPFGFIELLRALRHNDTADALLIAVGDKYKEKGVTAMIMDKMLRGFKKHGIKYLESTRELERNISVQNLWNKLDHELIKRARIYNRQI